MKSEIILSIAAAVTVLLFGVNPGGQEGWFWFVVPPIAIIIYTLVWVAEENVSSGYPETLWLVFMGAAIAALLAGLFAGGVLCRRFEK